MFFEFRGGNKKWNLRSNIENQSLYAKVFLRMLKVLLFVEKHIDNQCYSINTRIIFKLDQFRH